MASGFPERADYGPAASFNPVRFAWAGYAWRLSDGARVSEAVEIAFVGTIDAVGKVRCVIARPVIVVRFVERHGRVAANVLARIQMIKHARKIRVKSLHLADHVEDNARHAENVVLRLHMNIVTGLRSGGGKGRKFGKRQRAIRAGRKIGSDLVPYREIGIDEHIAANERLAREL